MVFSNGYLRSELLGCFHVGGSM